LAWVPGTHAIHDALFVACVAGHNGASERAFFPVFIEEVVVNEKSGTNSTRIGFGVCGKEVSVRDGLKFGEGIDIEVCFKRGVDLIVLGERFGVGHGSVDLS
jgi:hypothetical protein